jgi:uncharacterized membrane-anchored protein
LGSLKPTYKNNEDKAAAAAVVLVVVLEVCFVVHMQQTTGIIFGRNIFLWYEFCVSVVGLQVVIT